MNFWQALIHVAEGGVLADWRTAFGELHHLAAAYQVRRGERADSVPCPGHPACGCRHEVLALGDRLMAVCQCAPVEFGRCAPFHVTPEEAGVIEIDTPKLCADLASALGVHPPGNTAWPGLPVAPGCHRVGRHGTAQVPVILHLSRAAANQIAEVQQLCSPGNEPFLLLTPTRGRSHQEIEQMLRACESAWVRLDECLAPAARGGFETTRPIGPLLRDWQGPAWKSREALRLLRREIAAMVRQKAEAEPSSDGAAAQALALIQQLETQTNWRKAPVIQVFRLYCLEGLSASEIAHRCGCSKTLVVRRLGFLRKKLGRDPIQLRTVSSHFEAMEDALSDPRARHIRRQAAMEQDEEDDDSA
jgi:hypothetical protein